MKLFQQLLVATVSLGFIAPIATQASDFDIQEMNSYVSKKSSSRKQKLFNSNSFNNELATQKIKSSIEITSFENLKKNEEDEGFIERGMSREFFRKGIIGDWKSSLRPELLNKIESKFKKEMMELGYI